MSDHRMKPIWFFVGLMLLIMGSITFIAGIYEAVNPPMARTVLAETHPGIWWGAIMVVFGGMMFLKTRKESA